ncbi:MAG TPA: methionyl-tRNA formyltransferase [Hyphomicrobiales bacterium]|nr:methionyl-tRNA formyltransferase [Hyphomicrobiales bacterium]
MSASSLRIVFAGTPEFAAAHLQALLEQGFNVVSAYSQPDRPSGRGKKLLPTPVKSVAQEHGIPVHQPLTLEAPETLETLRALRPDLMVVVAYGLLLPPEVLALPRLGCLNVHASLLPRWRGAAPIERAIEAGDAETGACIMQMDAGLDTGPVLSCLHTPITPEDTSASLTQRLIDLGTQSLRDTLCALGQGPLPAAPQNGAHALYARKLHKREAEIDWQEPASRLDARIRAFYPRMPAFTWHQGNRVRLLKATPTATPHNAIPGSILKVSDHFIEIACGEGTLQVSEVQLEGRNAMSVQSLLNGHPDYFQVGEQLSQPPAAPPHG